MVWVAGALIPDEIRTVLVLQGNHLDENPRNFRHFDKFINKKQISESLPLSSFPLFPIGSLGEDSTKLHPRFCFPDVFFLYTPYR